jgi:hypothetical protein
MCPHTIICVLRHFIVVHYYTIICVLILLYKWPRIILYICPHTPISVLILMYLCPHTTIYMRPHECIFFLRLLYMCPHTIMCVIILLHTCPPTDAGVLIWLHMCPHACIKGPTNAYVWNTWILGVVGDVCTVVELGKLEGKHLSMMLSLVSTDPALPRLRGGGTDAANTTRFSYI